MTKTQRKKPQNHFKNILARLKRETKNYTSIAGGGSGTKKTKTKKHK